MVLSNKSILDVVELVYYILALVLALFVIRKHGFGREVGWIYLALLSLIRIISAATGIAAQNDPSDTTLEEITVILSSVGLSPLLLAWLGIISRVNSSMNSHGIPPRALQIINAPVIVGLVLAIYGGTKIFSTDVNTASQGLNYSKVAVILFLLTFIAIAFVTVYTSTQNRRVQRSERPLLFASAISIPFLFLRILYSLIVDFNWGSTTFSLTSTTDAAVVADAVMAILMEFIVVALYLAAGFLAPVVQSKVAHQPRNWIPLRR
ncbi:hypothetical protein MMC10_003199 [Thelotrema lepadinum]|nr:hypothetical protein [Thelotrema lepadinum]